MENYEEKYKEALERARQALLDGGISSNTIAYITNIFPELAENEDEKIKKVLTDYFKRYQEYGGDTFEGISVDNILAWLEREKDTSSTECVFRPTAGCDIESAAKQAVRQQQLGNKIVLAFNGAYISVEGKTDNEIVKEYHFWLEKQGEQKHTDKEVGNWIIQDAKDGDVLADKDAILIFRGIGNSERDDVIDYHCCYCYNRTAFMVQEDLDYWGHVWNNELRPATKNQRDLFFKKMKEAGYEWNADKKELRQVENKTQDPNNNETYSDAINRGWSEFEGNGISTLRPRDIYNVGFYDGYKFGKTKQK